MLDQIHEAYFDYSSKLGNRAVALSLSGLAIVWVFKTDGAEGPWLSGELLWPSVFFVAAVALDLFQTAFGVFAFGMLSRRHELDANGERWTKYPAWIDWPTVLMFYGKFVTCVIGYILLLAFVFGRFQ